LANAFVLCFCVYVVAAIRLQLKRVSIVLGHQSLTHPTPNQLERIPEMKQLGRPVVAAHQMSQDAVLIDVQTKTQGTVRFQSSCGASDADGETCWEDVGSVD
jgi:hypothetical protein